MNHAAPSVDGFRSGRIDWHGPSCKFYCCFKCLCSLGVVGEDNPSATRPTTLGLPLPNEIIRYEYKASLKLLISFIPYHSHRYNSLLPVLQRTWTVEATIKYSTWPMPIGPTCPKAID